MRTLSHTAQLVKTQDYDRFLLSLFVPPSRREAVLAVYALNAELAQIHERISEEMIGHIRFAWWEEALAKPPQGQPVLQALEEQHVPAELLQPLVAAYRSAYPDKPDIENILENITLALSPEAKTSWQKARMIIDKHRKKYGPKQNGWLSFKLLFF